MNKNLLNNCQQMQGEFVPNLCPDLPDYVQCCVGIPDGGLATGEVAPGLGDPGSGHEGYYEVSPVKGVGGFNWFGLLEGP